tara:strand:- start:307 stop:480 length:174 start_codon:yes stop_codon:yes gene_type:complete
MFEVINMTNGLVVAECASREEALMTAAQYADVNGLGSVTIHDSIAVVLVDDPIPSNG